MTVFKGTLKIFKFVHYRKEIPLELFISNQLLGERMFNSKYILEIICFCQENTQTSTPKKSFFGP